MLKFLAAISRAFKAWRQREAELSAKLQDFTNDGGTMFVMTKRQTARHSALIELDGLRQLSRRGPSCYR
jgi:hypothetical protein